jgi:predicted DCC family thiol-disulfide oxidoreductase YuxK
MENLSNNQLSVIPADNALVLFDGVCNLCNGAVDFIINRDKEGYFLFASLQSDIGRAFQEKLGYSVDNLDTIILVQDGKVYDRSSAALRIAERLDGLWPVLGIFKILPKFIRDSAYNLIANNRYTFFGQRETCRLPSPEEKARFIQS